MSMLLLVAVLVGVVSGSPNATTFPPTADVTESPDQEVDDPEIEPTTDVPASIDVTEKEEVPDLKTTKPKVEENEFDYVSPTVPNTGPVDHDDHDTPSKPEEHLEKDMVITLGEEAVMTCGEYTSGKWFREDVHLLGWTRGKATVDGSNVNNSGRYTCRVGNSSYTTNLMIQGENPMVLEPNITDSESVLTLTSGDPLFLNVSVNIWPSSRVEISAKFTKLTDDGHVERESELEVQVLANQVTFNVPSVTWERNNGRYEFTALYGTLRSTVSQTIRVMEAPSIKYFQRLSKFTTAGRNVSIKAKVTGHPPPVLNWYHHKCCIDTDTVSVNDDTSGIYEISGQTLLLNGVDDGLNGTYWFTVDHPLAPTNMTSPSTELAIRGWGVGIYSENQTLYENMGEFVLSCTVQDYPSFTGDYSLDILLNGDTLTSFQNLQFGDSDTRTIIHNSGAVGAEMEGTYQCVVTTATFTLWSEIMHVKFVPQPHFTIFPQNYSLSLGDTAIFSCLTSGVDPGSRVEFSAGTSPNILSAIPASEEEPGVVYIRDVRQRQYVQCATPNQHPEPVITGASTNFVAQSPVEMKVTTTTKNKYHETGDTVVLKCEIVSRFLLSEDAPPSVYWRHSGQVYNFRGSKGNVHMYFNGVEGNRTAHILAMQEVQHDQHSGEYTCVFQSPVHGRYEQRYEIFVKKALSSTVVSLMIAGAILLILLLLICMAILLARIHSPRHAGSYDIDTCTVATNALVKNEHLPEPSAADTSL